MRWWRSPLSRERRFTWELQMRRRQRGKKGRREDG
jgi:hypothetical protein